MIRSRRSQKTFRNDKESLLHFSKLSVLTFVEYLLVEAAVSGTDRWPACLPWSSSLIGVAELIFRQYRCSSLPSIELFKQANWFIDISLIKIPMDKYLLLTKKIWNFKTVQSTRFENHKSNSVLAEEQRSRPPNFNFNVVQSFTSTN